MKKAQLEKELQNLKMELSHQKAHEIALRKRIDDQSAVIDGYFDRANKLYLTIEELTEENQDLKSTIVGMALTMYHPSLDKKMEVRLAHNREVGDGGDDDPCCPRG